MIDLRLTNIFTPSQGGRTRYRDAHPLSRWPGSEDPSGGLAVSPGKKMGNALAIDTKKAPVSWDIDDIDDMMAQWIADGKGCNETQPQWKYHGMFHGIFSGRHKQHLLSGNWITTGIQPIDGTGVGSVSGHWAWFRGMPHFWTHHQGGG